MIFELNYSKSFFKFLSNKIFKIFFDINTFTYFFNNNSLIFLGDFLIDYSSVSSFLFSTKNLIINIISILIYIYLCFNPTKFIFHGIVCFLYSVDILIFEPLNVLGILFYSAFVFTFYFVGFFNYHKKIKITLFVIIIILDFLGLRFGKEILIHSLIDKVTTIIIIYGLFYIFLTKLKHEIMSGNPYKCVDLRNIKDFSQNDKELLRLLLTESKMETIAKTLELTSNGLRNKACKLYKRLDVLDRHSLLVKYRNSILILSDKDFEKYKKYFKPNLPILLDKL